MPDQLAIDLGTCHTVAMVRRDGQVPRPVLFDGSPLLGSGVCRTDDGDLAVGRDAERLARHAPDRYEPHPKRRVDDGTVLLGDAAVPVVDLLAALLRRVVAEASLGAGAAVTLTCPADWGAPRRDVLRAAATAAGLRAVRLVDEPVAAAAYCARVLDADIPPGRSLLVFDFGGGTLNVALVGRGPDGLRVLAVGGLDDLGGIDVDAALVGHLGALVAHQDPEAWRRLDAPRDAAEARDRQAFWAEVRAAKEMLSRVSVAPVHVPGRPDAVHLTRAELDRIAGPLVARAVDEARRVAARAPGGPAGILLVGGSSRIPLVATRLHARLGVAPTVPEQPELPVAFGGLLAPSAPGAVPPDTGAVPADPLPAGLVPAGLPPVGLVPVGPVPAGPVPAGPVPAGPVPTPVPDLPAPGQPVSGGGLPAAFTGIAAGPPAMAGTATEVRPAGRVPAGVRTGRRRRPWRGAVTLLVVLGVLVGLGYVGRGALRSAGRAFSAGVGRATTKDIALRQATGSPINLGSAGRTAVAAGGGHFFYAVGGSASTTVTAVTTAGRSAWHTTLPVGPATLSLRSVGSVVIVDAERSATDAGKDRREVLDAHTGKRLWGADWSNRTDAGYLRTDAIVDVRVDETFHTQRVDLRTGRARWTHETADADPIAEHRVAVPLRWSTDPAGPGDSAVPASTAPFAETLAGDASRIAELNTENGTAAVLATGDGRVTAHAAVPVDDKHWTVFDGLLVGALTDSGSPGQPAVGAWRLSDLHRVWTYKLEPDQRITAVHPCGPHVVCVSADGSDNNTMMGVGTDRGVAAWPKPVTTEFDQAPGCYVLAARPVCGDTTFPTILGGVGQRVSVLDPATGQRKADLGTPYVMAAAGRVGVQVDIDERNWRVRLVDLPTGHVTATVDTRTDDLPTGLAVDGAALAVLTKDHHLFLATASGLR